MIHRWLILICLLLQGTTSIATPLVVDPLTTQLDLSTTLRLLRDPAGQLDFTGVLARRDDFKQATQDDLVTGFNSGVIWVHLSLNTSSAQPITRWLSVGNPKTQFVTAYQSEQGGWGVQRSGRAIVPVERPILTLAPVFSVRLKPGQVTELFLSIDSRGTNNLESRLWLPEAYYPIELSRAVQVAALLGGLLLASGLALMMYMSLREPQYLWHALLMLAIAGLEGNRTNFLSTFVSPADHPLPPVFLALFATLSLFSLSKVAESALELAKCQPAANRLLMGLRWVAVSCALISLFHYGHGVRLLAVTSIVLNSTVLGLSMLAWHRKQPKSGIFLIAFSLALVVELARQFANLGLLPWTDLLDSSTVFFLLASPLILLGLLQKTRRLSERLSFADQLQVAKSAFLARVSHELRSPLNTILGYSRMLARGSSKLSLAEGSSGIEKSTLRLLRLIDELLDESRAAAGKLSLHPAPLALLPWLEEIERTARFTCDAKGNRLKCKFSGKLPANVRADGQRLRQVLDNLIANANRHTWQGTLTLECQGEQLDNTVTLAFALEDTGEGIPTSQLATLFEPFERGDTSTPGHGLGLSICRELIRQMGSDIFVTSTVGRGSRFFFSLSFPVIKHSSSAVPQEHVPLSLPHNSPSILLVDDDAIQLDLLAELCKEAGFAVKAVSGGRDAQVQIQAHAWNIILTDQMMPDVDGWGVLREARTLQPGVPVVMLSAAEPQQQPNIPPNMRFDVALLKPTFSEDILATLWQLLIKVSVGDTALNWGELARLASEGDVSAIEDWIASARCNFHHCDQAMVWLESLLNRLELALLERVATALAAP